jgi:hypothetical protein
MIPILMYHSISSEPENGHPYYWLNTPCSIFAEHMRYLWKHDYQVISLSRAVDIISGGAVAFGGEPEGGTASQRLCSCSGGSEGEWVAVGKAGHPVPPRFVVLTFDDGLRDVMLHAWPILKNFGYTATVFLATGAIGGSFKGKQCLNWAEVRELQRCGISFGSHTVNHRQLYGLEWKCLRKELYESRVEIERELQVRAPWFAYPFAFPQEDAGFVQRFGEELSRQGYVTAVTTAIGRAHIGNDVKSLRRLPINGGDDERLFEAKLAGAYDWVGGLQRIARRARRLL